MYCNVPRIVPWAVMGTVVCTIDELLPVMACPLAFANPKSSNFAPDFVSMMLPGFRSRWTIPWRCALSSASAI